MMNLQISLGVNPHLAFWFTTILDDPSLYLYMIYLRYFIYTCTYHRFTCNVGFVFKHCVFKYQPKSQTLYRIFCIFVARDLLAHDKFRGCKFVSSSLTLSFTILFIEQDILETSSSNKIFNVICNFNQFQIVDKSIEISMNQQDAVIVMEEIQKKWTKPQIAWFISLFASGLEFQNKDIHSVVQTPQTPAPSKGRCKFWYTPQKLTNTSCQGLGRWLPSSIIFPCKIWTTNELIPL